MNKKRADNMLEARRLMKEARSILEDLYSIELVDKITSKKKAKTHDLIAGVLESLNDAIYGIIPIIPERFSIDECIARVEWESSKNNTNQTDPQ